MKYKFYTLLFLVFSATYTLFAINPNRSIAIFNLGERNGETNNSRLFSVKHIMDVVGIPYIITNDLAKAKQYSMVFCTSSLKNNTFNAEEELTLKNYVSNGGTLFAPRIENNDLFSLFGLRGYQEGKSRFQIDWDTALITPALRWIDEPEERTISLGRSSYDEIFKTLGYLSGGAKTLGYFEDGTSAITQYAFGSGQAIAIGLSWKEVILRNHINRDYEAQRITSNGFEPTMDALILFVRAVYAAHHPYTVWKHTSPGNSRGTLMITHDVDSRTGVDTLPIFVEYEQSKKIEATYNITLRYFSDALFSDIYNNNHQIFANILNSGHQIQSHSVGHFFDFADEEIVPIGTKGNEKASYKPYNDGKKTTGATVYGECEVSKNELEKDFGINVRTFRAGHLVYPKVLVDVLDDLGYEYNSTHSASDVLTNFPYQNVLSRSFSTPLSNVYEIPVTISDVFHSAPISKTNYLDKAETWLKVTRQNLANNAPTVLLIHPNRKYKLDGMRHYLKGLKQERLHIMEMGKFGDYWKARTALDFESTLNDNKLVINIPESQNLDNDISFIVNNGQDLFDIVVQNDLNQPLSFIQEDWEGNDVILYYKAVISNTNNLLVNPITFEVFPNPAKDIFNIELMVNKPTNIQLNLLDIQGKQTIPTIYKKVHSGQNNWTLQVAGPDTTTGIYFIVLKSESGQIWRKKIVLE